MTVPMHNTNPWLAGRNTAGVLKASEEADGKPELRILDLAREMRVRVAPLKLILEKTSFLPRINTHEEYKC